MALVYRSPKSPTADRHKQKGRHADRTERGKRCRTKQPERILLDRLVREAVSLFDPGDVLLYAGTKREAREKMVRLLHGLRPNLLKSVAGNDGAEQQRLIHAIRRAGCAGPQGDYNTGKFVVWRLMPGQQSQRDRIIEGHKLRLKARHMNLKALRRLQRKQIKTLSSLAD